jgi:phospholipid transport system transporter-binding protein
VAAADISKDGQGRLRFHGDLGFASVAALRLQWPGISAGPATLEVDLSDVQRADSAGLALLVDCARRARQMGQSIRFFNIPAQMLAIARVSGLDEVLPLHRD